MQELRYEEYIDKLRQGAACNRVPLSVTFELTYRCNFRCLPCYAMEDKTKKEMSTKEVLNILDQLKQSGTLHIYFTGGEIFLRKDLLGILSYAKYKGLLMTLISNGTLITEELADRLLVLGIDKFQISFYGATKETFEKITQVNGSYERVLANLKMLKQKGAYVTMLILVVNANLDEVKLMLEMAKELGISSTYSDLILPKFSGDKNAMCHQISPHDFIKLTGEINGDAQTNTYRTQMKWDSSKPNANNNQADCYFSRENLFYCVAGRESVCITPYGLMNACVGFPFPGYDILRGSVKGAWKAVKKFVDSMKAPDDWECRHCDLRHYCTSCPVWAYLYTGSMKRCPPYFRELARLYKERSESQSVCHQKD